MLERILMVTSILMLTACGQSADNATKAPPLRAVSAACNQVTPNLSIAAMMRGDTVPASAMPPLKGGRIAPGLYDLASGEQLDGAPSWEDTRYVSLSVRDSSTGTVLEWGQLAGSDGKTRSEWTALLRKGPPASLAVSCGRSGTVTIS